jgi:hypothetical protein
MLIRVKSAFDAVAKRHRNNRTMHTSLTMIAATGAALLAAPFASAQTVVHDWGAKDMAAIFTELQIDKVAQSARKDGTPVVSGKTAGVLIGAIGDSCKEGANARCGAVDFVCDLAFTDAAKADKAMGVLVYPQAAALRASPTIIRLHRHVLMEGGVSDDNLRANVMLFVQTIFDAQNKLEEARLD